MQAEIAVDLAEGNMVAVVPFGKLTIMLVMDTIIPDGHSGLSVVRDWTNFCPVTFALS